MNLLELIMMNSIIVLRTFSSRPPTNIIQHKLKFIFSSESDIVVDKTGRLARHEAGAGRVIVACGGGGDQVAGALLRIERPALPRTTII